MKISILFTFFLSSSARITQNYIVCENIEHTKRLIATVANTVRILVL